MHILIGELCVILLDKSSSIVYYLIRRTLGSGVGTSFTLPLLIPSFSEGVSSKEYDETIVGAGCGGDGQLGSPGPSIDFFGIDRHRRHAGIVGIIVRGYKVGVVAMIGGQPRFTTSIDPNFVVNKEKLRRVASRECAFVGGMVLCKQ